MCLAALVDAGVPLEYLQERLATLGLTDEFTLTVSPTLRQGLRALYAEVKLSSGPTAATAGSSTQPGQSHSHRQSPEAPNGEHSVGPGNDPSADPHDPRHTAAQSTPTRNLPAIEQLINQAELPERARQWSLSVFRRLAEAEAAVHGIAMEQVHFHEVGAIDAIVDVVGTCLGLDYLGVDILVCSPLPTGRGRVRAAHGWLPVPAPAVLKLLEMRQAPLYGNDLEGELVTPTGAAIATTLADHFGNPPPMTLLGTGLGAGGKDLPVANILRLWVGQPTPSSHPPHQATEPTQKPHPIPASSPIPYGTETITLLETQVDDMIPQAVGYLHERLYAAGALEVFTQPIAMKKSRPGLLITVICHPSQESQCTDILFSETPTLGLRRQSQQRWVLPRQIQTLQTPYGPLAVKLAYHPHTQAVLNFHPEYEDCAALARRHRIPWQVVYHTAISTWYSQQPSPSSVERPLP